MTWSPTRSRRSALDERGETLKSAAAVAAGGVALTLAAFAFDASPLFVPGVALILLGAFTPAWVWLAAGSARISRRLHATTTIEDEPVEATIEISRGPLGLPGAEILDPLAGESLPLGSVLLHTEVTA